jgi:hypothetical protein
VKKTPPPATSYIRFTLFSETTTAGPYCKSGHREQETENKVLKIETVEKTQNKATTATMLTKGNNLAEQ